MPAWSAPHLLAVTEFNMSIKLLYGRAIRKQLSHFPTWDPCSVAELGDYGEINENCFTRIGSLAADYGLRVQSEAGDAHSWQFGSSGSILQRGDVSASGFEDSPLLTRGSLSLKFGAAHSLFVRSHRSRWEELLNVSDLNDCVRAIKKSAHSGQRGWSSKYAVVTARRIADPLTLFMTLRGNAGIQVSGKASLLDDFEAGRLAAATGLQIEGDAGLQVVGAKGPVLLDLMKFGLFGSGPAALPGAGAGGGVRLDPRQGIE